MLRARPVLLACVLAAVLAGGALVRGWAPPAIAVGASVQPKIAAPAPAAVPPPSATPADPPRPRALPARPASTPETLATQVDRLSRSPDPLDAFAAYQLVTRCLWARDHEGWMVHHILPGDRALLPTPQQSCGDIASDQVQSRLQWLQRAALAGVHHAAAELLKEGPDGLGITGSDDPDAPGNAAWKTRVDEAVDAGVRTCDPESLDYRVSGYESGLGVPEDRAKALMYWVAYVDCRQRLADAGAPLLDNRASVTQRMGGALSAEQIATAVAAGQKLARDATPLPGDR